jgi:hypothetical protein
MGIEQLNEDRKPNNIGLKSFGLDKELETIGKFSSCRCAAHGLRKYCNSVDKHGTLDFISIDE